MRVFNAAANGAAVARGPGIHASAPGAWPSRRVDDNAVRQRWDRLRKRASKTADHVPEHLRPLLAECEAGNDSDLSESQGGDPNGGFVMEVL